MQQTTRPGRANSFGIRVYNGGITINNCQILACGNALYLSPGTGQAVVSMWVMNSGFDNCISGMFVQPSGSGFVGRSWFIGCWFSSSDISGVTLNPVGGSSSIDGMDFINCHVFGNGQHGF